LDVGRTLTRFNLNQAEVFNPLGILLAHHLTQLDEAQRDATDGTEDNGGGDDQPRPEVADAVLTTPTMSIAREPSEPEPADDGERGGEGSGAGDGIVVRNLRSTDPTSLPRDIPIDSIRVDFTAGNIRFTTESTVNITLPDEGPSGAPDDQSPATDTVAEDQTDVGTSTLPERVREGTITIPITRSE